MTGRSTLPAVKICGIRTADDAAFAAAAGAAYIGVILTPGFPRSRTLDQAEQILASAGAALRAGVFVNAGVDDVVSAARRLKLDVVQLHGAESTDQIAAIRASVPVEVWKTVRVLRAGDLERAAAECNGVDALLLEGASDRGHGGVGAAFDWSCVADERSRVSPVRVVAAGGLTADNVADLIRVLGPDVVDVSSGVEDAASPGRKSASRVTAFIAAARGVKGSA